MELSEIDNWPEVQQIIAAVAARLIQIDIDTEKDIYGYFQGMKDIADHQKLICPHCLEEITLKLEAQKTMVDWENENRSEPNAMTFEQHREYIGHEVARQIVNVLIQAKTKPTDVESRLSQMEQLVKTISYISELLADLIPAIDRAQTQEDIIHTMTETITDIQKAIKKSI